MKCWEGENDKRLYVGGDLAFMSFYISESSDICLYMDILIPSNLLEYPKLFVYIFFGIIIAYHVFWLFVYLLYPLFECELMEDKICFFLKSHKCLVNISKI